MMSALLDEMIETEKAFRQTVNAAGDIHEVSMADRRLKLMDDLKRFSNGHVGPPDDDAEEQFKKYIDTLSGKVWSVDEVVALATCYTPSSE